MAPTRGVSIKLAVPSTRPPYPMRPDTDGSLPRGATRPKVLYTCGFRRIRVRNPWATLSQVALMHDFDDLDWDGPTLIPIKSLWKDSILRKRRPWPL